MLPIGLKMPLTIGKVWLQGHAQHTRQASSMLGRRSDCPLRRVKRLGRLRSLTNDCYQKLNLNIRQAVVLTQCTFRNICPPIRFTHIRAARWIQGVKDSAALLRRFSAHKQDDFIAAVIDEAVRNASACGERRQITRAHRVDIAVDPSVYFTSNDINKLLFILFSVRP